MEAYKYKQAYIANQSSTGSSSSSRSVGAPAEAVNFKDLDVNFHNLTTVSDDEFVYQASDVLVQSTWELPIVVQYPGTEISFEFTTTMGDILFGIMFVAALGEDEEEDDMRAETLDEMGRVLSNEEPYGGSFTPRCEGVVFFVWDNSHDWYSHKTVSYKIRLAQPTFSFADQDRRKRCEELLPLRTQLREQTAIAHADCEDKAESCTYKIPLVERKIKLLEGKLSELRVELEGAQQARTRLATDLDTHSTCITGLGLRCLDKRCVGRILSFLCPSPGGAADRSVLLVCKYWLLLCDELLRQRLLGAQSDLSHNPRSSSEPAIITAAPSRATAEELDATATSITATADWGSEGSPTGSGRRMELDETLSVFEPGIGSPLVSPATTRRVGSRHKPAVPLTEQALFKSTLRQKTLTARQTQVTQQKLEDFKLYQREQQKKADPDGVGGNKLPRAKGDKERGRRVANDRGNSQGHEKGTRDLGRELESSLEGEIEDIINTLDHDLAVQQSTMQSAGGTGARAATRTARAEPEPTTVEVEVGSCGTNRSEDDIEPLEPRVELRPARDPTREPTHVAEQPGSGPASGGVTTFLASRSRREVVAWLSVVQREQTRLQKLGVVCRRARKALQTWAAAHQRSSEAEAGTRAGRGGRVSMSREFLRREAGPVYAEFERASRDVMLAEKYIEDTLAAAALTRNEFEAVAFQHQN